MRISECLNNDWRFFKGDIPVNFPQDKQMIYSQAKTESYRNGPAARAYQDITAVKDLDKVFPAERWERIRLPHDYVVMGTPVETENNTRGYLKYDNAWYRKHFILPPEDEGKRLVVEFEGVSGKSSVFFNGCPVKYNYCGYTSFEVDITDLAKFGEEGENVLAVYIDATGFEGWWYEGSGIYRSVWLRKTDAIAVDTDGVYVCPQKQTGETWLVNVETTIYSIADKEEPVQLRTRLFAPDGVVAAEATAELTAVPYDRSVAKYQMQVAVPKLWDVDDPVLYTVETVVVRGGEVCDVYTTRTGFRYYTCDPQKGFFLNGRNLKIQGVCVHDDCGLLGKAIPDNVHRYKMELLKEMGANGYRAAHYEQNKAILDAADELGFIVLNEPRWFSSAEVHISQLERLVKRDRNRPSVFFWALGNEEYCFHKPQGRRIVQSMKAALRRLDPVRPVTCAVDKTPEQATVYEELDLIGINYNLDTYDPLHVRYPDKPVLSTENSATSTTRGWYAPDCPEVGYYGAWDKDTTRIFLGRERSWKFIMERPWVMGGYQWSGFEHRGETVWPRLCSQAGAIDLFLQKKDAFYQNQSFWSKVPMVHIMPHWNITVFDGESAPVVIYTNCEEVELRLNGESLGCRQTEKNTALRWPVEYIPGKLEAVGYINGNIAAMDTVETAGTPVKLRLRLENKMEKPEDVAIVTCYCEDAEGRFVPDACPKVLFHTNPFGQVLSTGSDVTDHTPLCAPVRKMRAGLISVAAGVRTDKGGFVAESGVIELYAQSPGLESARLRIPVGGGER